MRTSLLSVLLGASMMLQATAFAGEFRNAAFTSDIGVGYFHPFTKMAPHEKTPGNFTAYVSPGVYFEHVAFNLSVGYEAYTTGEKYYVHDTQVKNLLVDVTARIYPDTFVFDPVRLYVGGGLNCVFQSVRSPYLKATAIGYEEAERSTSDSGFGPMVFGGFEVGNDNHQFFFQATFDAYFGLQKTMLAVRPTIGYRFTF